MRPTTLDDVIGQQHILGPDKMLRYLIEADMLSSIILYGPPGTGKTTIANVIAHTTQSHFKSVNATTSGKKDIQEVIDFAQKELENNAKKTILFIDEIHRFNKAQQDYLLPYVENGTVILVGATTENPYFEVNGALLSRSNIFEVNPLSSEDIVSALHRIIDKLNKETPTIIYNADEDALQFFADAANGDARNAINGLDLAIRVTPAFGAANGSASQINITKDIAMNCIQKKIVQYDKDGDNHYDTISAFIESMKHSEVDAALYYLARMIDRGEDPKYIARRLMVCASMDIGLADPNALNLAASTFQTVEKVGLPECVWALALSTVYNCVAPKTHSVADAYEQAMEDVQNIPNVEIPYFLKDESYKSAHKLGHGGITDVFAAPFHYDGSDCMPTALTGHKYFHPTNFGYEETVSKVMTWYDDYKKTHPCPDYYPKGETQ
jgi:putative ATPase